MCQVLYHTWCQARKDIPPGRDWSLATTRLPSTSYIRPELMSKAGPEHVEGSSPKSGFKRNFFLSSIQHQASSPAAWRDSPQVVQHLRRQPVVSLPSRASGSNDMAERPVVSLKAERPVVSLNAERLVGLGRSFAIFFICR